MRSAARSVVAVVAGITLFPAPTFAALPGPGERWIDLRTPNFVIFSHIGERATRAIATDLEELHAVLGAFSPPELTTPVPTYIYVFRNDRDFRPYKPHRDGRPSSVSGFFTPRQHGNYIAIDGNARRDATAIVYHEYVHYFVANNLRGLPLWFEEGLAELYSTFRITGGTVQFGFPDPIHLMLLRNSSFIPLDELVTADHHSDLYNERDRKSMFYAESWALVHYLLVDSDERRRQTLAFLDLVRAGVPVEDALARCLGTDLENLERELRMYGQRMVFDHLESPVSVEVDHPVTVRRLSHADVLYRLGDLLLGRDGSGSDAQKHFEAAVEADPEHGLSWSALGVLAEQHARWSDAGSFHERALACSPHEAFVQYRAGVFLFERGGDIDAAVAALQRATDLAPGFGPAWVELTRAYRTSGQRGSEAIAAAETAHRLNPSRDDVTLDLLRLYLADDRRDDAVALVRRSFTGTSGYRARAWSNVADNDLARVRMLLAEGHLEAASQRLDLARRIVDGTDAPASFLMRVESLQSDLELLEFGRSYDEAVALYNRGDREAARGILVELLDDNPGGRQAQAIDSMLRRIDQGPEDASEGPGREPVRGITRSDIEELNRRMSRHDLEGARSLLHDLKLRARPEEFEWIDRRLAEIRVIHDYNHFVEQYNLAVDQFNDGDFEAAVTTLERLLAGQPDVYGADDARDLLRDARAELGLD